MQTLTEKNFGYVIAFLIPGFIGLWGVSYISPLARSWVMNTPNRIPTIGGFLYTTLASITMGLIIHTVRWAFLDTLHSRTGLAKPKLDFSRFKEVMKEFDYINENHGRYYQFYGNTLIAIILTYTIRQISLQKPPWSDWIIMVGVLALLGILFIGSRDSLRKVHERTAALMQEGGGEPK